MIPDVAEDENGDNFYFPLGAFFGGFLIEKERVLEIRKKVSRLHYGYIFFLFFFFFAESQESINFNNLYLILFLALVLFYIVCIFSIKDLRRENFNFLNYFKMKNKEISIKRYGFLLLILLLIVLMYITFLVIEGQKTVFPSDILCIPYYSYMSLCILSDYYNVHDPHFD